MPWPLDLGVSGHGIAVSSSRATDRSLRSAPRGAATCTPMGSPAEDRANGSEIAGAPVMF